MMVFGKNVSGSNPLENMTYPLFSSPTFYMSGAVWVRIWRKMARWSGKSPDNDIQIRKSEMLSILEQFSVILRHKLKINIALLAVVQTQ